MNPFERISLLKENYQTGWLDAYAQSTSKSLWKEEPIEFLPDYVDRFKKNNVRHILDVGCGDGRNAIFLLKNGFSVTGIDLSPIATRKASDWAQSAGLQNATFLNTDIEEFPWALDENAFDSIVCLDVFGQILKIDSLVNNFYRTIRPGGYVLTNLYTPQDAAYSIGKAVGHNTFLYKDTLWRFFTKEDIKKIFSKFTIVDIKSLTWVDPPHPGYRDDPHTHDSYIVLLQKGIELPGV